MRVGISGTHWGDTPMLELSGPPRALGQLATAYSWGAGRYLTVP